MINSKVWLSVAGLATIVPVRIDVHPRLDWEGPMVNRILPSCVNIIAPVRLDYWNYGASDLPLISRSEGIHVLNAAVALEKPLSVTAWSLPRPVFQLHCAGYPPIEIPMDAAMSEYIPIGPFRLPVTALRMVGRPLNGSGVALGWHSPVAVGSGLGISGILGAATIDALSRFRGLGRISRGNLATAALQLEQTIGAGGCQDAIGGIFPGLKWINSPPSLSPQPIVRCMALPATARCALTSSCLLIHLGFSHSSALVLSSLLSQFMAGRPPLDSSLGNRMVTALRKADMSSFGDLLTQAHRELAACAPGFEPTEVGSLLSHIAPYIYGAKSMGAGAGGALLCIVRPGAAKPFQCALRDFAAAVPICSGLTILPMRFVNWGLHHTTSTASAA